MSGRRQNPYNESPASRPPGPTVLNIGRVGVETEGYLRGRNASVVAASFAVLDRPLLARIAPDAVAFLLIGAEADATQVLERLGQFGFSGEAIVFAPRLPDRQMVLRELRGLATGMALTVVEPGEGQDAAPPA